MSLVPEYSTLPSELLSHRDVAHGGVPRAVWGSQFVAMQLLS